MGLQTCSHKIDHIYTFIQYTNYKSKCTTKTLTIIGKFINPKVKIMTFFTVKKLIGAVGAQVFGQHVIREHHEVDWSASEGKEHSGTATAEPQEWYQYDTPATPTSTSTAATPTSTSTAATATTPTSTSSAAIATAKNRIMITEVF